MTKEQKTEIHNSLIASLEAQLYTSTVMGKTWHEIGNNELAKANADKAAEFQKAIDSQKKQLAELK